MSIVEEVGGQFGISQGEIRERRAFVGRLEGEVEVSPGPVRCSLLLKED